KGKGRFRLAVAILPPDRARLEFFGPSGGPWLVVTATPDTTLALLPAQRVYEQAGPPAKAIERFPGVPPQAPGLIALLAARPASRIQLSAVEGPWGSAVPEAIFPPEIPEGFESTTLSLFPAGPGLPGAESHPAN